MDPSIAASNARAVEVLRAGGTLSEAAGAAGVSRAGLDKRARGDGALAAAMGERRERWGSVTAREREERAERAQRDRWLELLPERDRVRLWLAWVDPYVTQAEAASRVGLTVWQASRVMRRMGWCPGNRPSDLR